MFRNVCKIALTVLATGFLVINSAYADTIYEPQKQQKPEENKLETEYDFVKDITTVFGRAIRFRTGDLRVSDDGVDYSYNTTLYTAYAYEGKKPKAPTFVTISLNVWNDYTPKIDKVYFRFGSKKLVLPVASSVSKDTYSSTTSASGRIPTNIFIQMSKAKEIYFKFDSQDAAYHITNPFMTYLSELSGTIPNKKK